MRRYIRLSDGSYLDVEAVAYLGKPLEEDYISESVNLDKTVVLVGGREIELSERDAQRIRAILQRQTYDPVMKPSSTSTVGRYNSEVLQHKESAYDPPE